MVSEYEKLIGDEAEMRSFGAGLMRSGISGAVITLRGDLGTGKTTLVRGALESKGITRVRSPTYTLIEYYPLETVTVVHLDLYRLADAEELEFLGFRDYLSADTLCFIEWPERAQGYLQTIDLDIRLEYHVQGRCLRCRPGSTRGEALLAVS